MFVSRHSQTMRGILKRKFTEEDDNPCYSSSSLSSPASSEFESDGESGSSDSRDFTPHNPASPASLPVRSILKRPRLTSGQGNVRFDLVTVFSFPRCQGFTSVPSRGGATLGMARRHSTLQRYTVAEHAAEQQHKHRERLRDRRRGQRLETMKRKLIASGAIDQREADRLTVDQVPHEDTDVHVSDSELEDGGFLQPYSSRQRQALLLAAGVKRIDKEEKRQLHALRVSREACGCDCQGFCEPETCACSLAGIKCQVDRAKFPCGCTKDGCGNAQGHVTFDSGRVQTHYIHTVMRLELERRLQDETRGRESQTRPPEDPLERGDQGEADKTCPFGFPLEEEDGLPLTMPATPPFQFSPERPGVEENSCSSDMTETSCSSSDSEAAGRPPGGRRVQEVGGGLPRAHDTCDSANSSYSVCSQLRRREALAQQSSGMEPLTENISRASVTSYLDENANQALDLFDDDDSLEDYPNTPSPTVDYSSGRYMDLSLSSDSDLEFFDCDYPPGPLHSAFKGHRHPDSFRHLQLFSSAHLPQYESSTYLLESLIGLTEPSSEQVYVNPL